MSSPSGSNANTQVSSATKSRPTTAPVDSSANSTLFPSAPPAGAANAANPPQSYVPPPPPDPLTKRLPQSESIGIWVKCALDGQKINTALQYYLNSIEAYLMPLRPNRDGLINIYCRTVHPLLPLLDKDQFLKLHSIGQAPTLLLHAVLLVAARYPDAKEFLGPQSVRDFCAITAEKIRALLYAEVEQDRLTLLRVHALLSLHAEGPDGLENSCSDLQKALHYAVSLGLHHNKDKLTDGDDAPTPDTREQIDLNCEFRNIWWSLWCLDRISACVNARPLIVNLEDVSVKYTTASQHAVLASLIESCKTLERVIYLYRPNPILQRGSAASVFVSIFGTNLQKGGKMPEPNVTDSISAVLSLIQYTAIILAHKRRTDESRIEDRSPPDHQHILQGNRIPEASSRYGASPGAGLPGTPRGHIRTGSTSRNRPDSSSSEYATSDSTNRVLLEATRHILYIVENYGDILPPLPLVPYCVSLTLTIFLRTYPQVDTSVIEGGKIYTWRDSAELLKSLSNRWWVAAAMGKMGQTVFKRLEDEKASKSAVKDINPISASSQIRPNQEDSLAISQSQQTLPRTSTNTQFQEYDGPSGTFGFNVNNDSPSHAPNASSSHQQIQPQKEQQNEQFQQQLLLLQQQFKDNKVDNVSNEQLFDDYLDTQMVNSTSPESLFNSGTGSIGSFTPASNVGRGQFQAQRQLPGQGQLPVGNSDQNDGSNNNKPNNIGSQILDMFSQLPNPTSFLDSAMRSGDIEMFDDLKTWEGWDL